jgi:hypothetical protein
MKTLIAVFLLVNFNATAPWWVAFGLIMFVQFLIELSKALDKK